LIRKGNKIKVTDLFIGSIAIHNNLPVATIDKKDFPGIKKLKIIVPDGR